VLLGPAIGRDAAVIDLGHDRVLVATSDPITFATEDIGWYAVNVNANDIACMGARPAWFLATLLLPADTPDDVPAKIFEQLVGAAEALGIALIGGHTEVTPAVARPIIAGTMLGEASRGHVVTGEGITPGDAIVLAGDIAIEGTALLAREARAELTARGIGAGTIDSAARLLHDPGISIVAHADSLLTIAKPRLMHDPTEGGITNALHELAAAANATLRIDARALAVRPETALMCDALGLGALGLISSGALLAIVPAADLARLTSSTAPTAFRVIGRVEAGEPTVILEPEGAPLPMFDRDELARFFDGMAGG
jgi:hydrogenase maturation factor